MELGIFYISEGKLELLSYTDSDYAGDVNDRKSTSGYMFLPGTGAIAWTFKKQPVVTLSTTKVEFIFSSSVCFTSSLVEKDFGEIGAT